MTKKYLLLFVLLLGLLLNTPIVFAVINAGLQPYDLVKYRYTHVFSLAIDKVDTSKNEVVAHVVESYKGTYKPDTLITLELTGQLKDAINDACFTAERPIVAFVGRQRRSKDLMIYADGFYLGQITAQGKWTMDTSSEQTVGMDGKSIGTLAGTWNGSTDQLIRLMQDIAAGRDHFPRKAYAQFKPDLLLDTLEQPIAAIGLYDIEGDGDEDIIACSPAGDRIYLQTDPMKFVDATQRIGLESSSVSCSFGDFNSDFLNDLLLGDTLYMGVFADNRFQLKKTNLLPADIIGLKSSSFVELNGDGLPDIIVTTAGKGLRSFINQKGVSFKETTAEMGLDQANCGTNQTGFVSVGDWNGDLRSDLFYAAGTGFLLVQNAAGHFAPVSHNVAYKFTVGISEEPGHTGAGVFLPLLSPNQMDLVTPIEDGWLTVANKLGKPIDVTPWGNEISEGSSDHLSMAAADLNLDGHVDFYTVSNTANGHNRFIINRGYGSFMLATTHKHYEHMFAGPAHQRGGTAVTAGDIDDDGSPDLVVGNQHGEITIILNDTLAARQPIPNAPREIVVLQETRLLSVRVIGSKGVVNARIELFDADKRLVARSDLGTSIGGGSWGPNRTTLAVRQPAIYELTVTYADGLKRTQTVDLTPQQRLAITVDRGKGDSNDDW